MTKRLDNLIKLAGLGRQLIRAGMDRAEEGLPPALRMPTAGGNFDSDTGFSENFAAARTVSNIKNRAPKLWDKHMSALKGIKEIGAVADSSPTASANLGGGGIMGLLTGNLKEPKIGYNPLMPDSAFHEIGHVKDYKQNLLARLESPGTLRSERNATKLSGLAPLHKVTQTRTGLPVSLADAYTSYSVPGEEPLIKNPLVSHKIAIKPNELSGAIKELEPIKKIFPSSAHKLVPTGYEHANLFNNPEHWRQLSLRDKINMLRETKAEAGTVEQAFGIPAQKYYNRLKEMLRFALKRRGVI